MNIGVKGNITILSCSKRSYNGKDYFNLAVMGTDGECGNLDCTDDVFNKVSALPLFFSLLKLLVDFIH